MRAVAVAGPLTRIRRLRGRLLIALAAGEHFCSRKIKCYQCSERRRSDDGGGECFLASARRVGTGSRRHSSPSSVT
jgi:hypothetical protein